MDATGRCYEVCAKYVLDHRGNNDLVLAHGRPTLQVEPYEKYGHAWVEDQTSGEVIDPTADITLPREIYYSLGKVNYRDVRLYTKKETAAFMLYFSHYGPWEGPEAVEPLEDHKDDFQPQEKPTRSLEPEDPHD